jgi:hypothetical protein
MTCRNTYLAGAWSAAVISIAMTLSGAATAVAADAKAAAWKAPRTLDGQPDLQGNWNNATITPVERPAQYGDRRALTMAEAQALENQEAGDIEKSNLPTDPKLGIKDLPVNCGKGFTGTNCGYNGFWIDAGTHVIDINGEKRSSIVIDPPSGKIPRAAGARRGFGGRARGGAYDGPEVRSLGERCLMSFGSSAGPPMLPLLYNNNYQIVQTPDAVLILVEMVHDARVIRIGGQHKPNKIRQWMGDSVGHWEGDTLVVETANLRSEQGFRGASENAKYIERFTRIGPKQISYQFAIDDPAVWEKSWGGEVAMNATNDNIYEYACHEGNYALPGILAGAREEERAKAKAGAEVKK